MKLRRREAGWLVLLGVVLLVIRGMDAHTASMRQKSAAQGHGNNPDAAAPAGGAVLDQLGGSASNQPPGALLSATDLAGLAWGGNPFARDFGTGGETAPIGVEGEEGATVEASQRLPRFGGIVRVNGGTLAVLDGRFVPAGGRYSAWIVEAVSARGVRLRDASTGVEHELKRDGGTVGRGTASVPGEAGR